MAKNKIHIEGLNKLEEKAKKYVQNICRITAGTIRDELTKETASAIAAFYADYTPKYYRRHFYNFQNNSFRKYYSNKHGSVYYGGVKLTPSRMADIYQNPTEEVFDFVYHGFHGVSSGFVSPKTFSVTPVMKPSPLELIYKKKDYIVNNIDKYIKNAQKQVIM